MNPEHITYQLQAKALRRFLRLIKRDIALFGVEGAYDLLHARNAQLILRTQMMETMGKEEALTNVAIFGALQYIEGLFLNQEIQDACENA